MNDHTHVVPARTLLTTFGALLALTALTVAASRADFGQLNVAVAIGIAVVKATLVALVFMHLRYEGRYLRTVLVGAIAFAVMFTGFVAFDTLQYQPEVRAKEAAAQIKPQPASASGAAATPNPTRP